MRQREACVAIFGRIGKYLFEDIRNEINITLVAVTKDLSLMTKSKDRRLFMGWKRPVVDCVVDHLLGAYDAERGTPIDLEKLLIVVPTRQAGRRLREALALKCADLGRTLLSAKVVTPHYFFGQDFLPPKVAGPAARRAVWIDVLLKADISKYAALFPADTGERTFQWASRTAELIEKLREELSDAALSIGTVCSEHGADLEELERWQAMQALEVDYLAAMQVHGFKDNCTAKVECVSDAAGKLDAERVVMASVPDPSLLALKALAGIAKTKDVEVLIHAPKEDAGLFDEWGRPVPAKWTVRHVEMPEFDRAVFLEPGAAEQSRRVLRLIHEHTGKFESGELAIGVPDTGLIPFLEKDLGAEGLPPFDPSDLRVSDHTLGRLASALLAVMQGRSYETVAALLRHPDFAQYLSAEHKLEVTDILTQLDEFQNYYLPVTLDNMLDAFRESDKGTDDWRHDFTELGKALKQIDTLLDIFDRNDFEEGWRECFKTIYTCRMLDSAEVRDSQFESAAMGMDSVLRGFRELAQCDCSLTKTQLASIFVSELQGAMFHAERNDQVVDLEGWLELAWNNRPFLLLTGFNDNFVPGGSLSDAFLPDTLRGKLGLRDDRARFARDIYLLTGMVESRRDGGLVRIVVGKTSSAGDPLRPSRLLFRCADAELPDRVEKLLAAVEDNQARHASEIIFKLKPGAPARVNDIQQRKKISVTAFSDYLECPFRFYLKHVLRMEELDDLKTGMDHMDFGSIVHAVLEAMGRNRELWSCADPVKLAAELGRIAERHVKMRYPNPLPLSVHISLMSAVQRLKGVARVQASLVAEGWDIMEAEAGEAWKDRERWQLNRGGFTISGRIDRIDINRNTGAIRIIDYKSSDTATSPDKAHMKQRKGDVPEWNLFRQVKETAKGATAKDSQWIDLQLPIYALIYANGKKVPENLEVAYFNLPKAISQTGVYVWDGFGPQHVESAEKCLDGAIESIAKGMFWEPAPKVRYENFGALFNNEIEKAFDLEGWVGKPET